MLPLKVFWKEEFQVSLISDTWNPKFKMDLLLKVHLYLKHETGNQVAGMSCRWHQAEDA